MSFRDQTDILSIARSSYSNVYGIDMPSRSELVAHNRSTEDVADAIGADLVIFQTLSDLIGACRQFNPSIERFDCSVFDGCYVTGGVDEAYLGALERLRGDNLKKKSEESGTQTPGEAAVEIGGLGVLEGKGGGGLKRLSAVNGFQANGHSQIMDEVEDRDSMAGGVGIENEGRSRRSSQSGVGDHTVGLHNSWVETR